MAPTVQQIEEASALRRGLEVWYPVAGPVLIWMAHLVFCVSAEHWAYIYPRWGWTLNAATAVTAAATVVAILLAWRLMGIARGADESGQDDAGQLLFLAQLGILVGIINLALILAEGAYIWVLPHS
ncbi:MAG: hypothetical protein ACRDZ8_21060 [Acidimicrobiales bacterium]